MDNASTAPERISEREFLDRYGEVMTGRVSISDPIMAGDTIYVRERLF